MKELPITERKLVHEARLKKNRVHQVIKMMDDYGLCVKDIEDYINMDESEYNFAKLGVHRKQLASKAKAAQSLKAALEERMRKAKVKKEQLEKEKEEKKAAAFLKSIGGTHKKEDGQQETEG